MYFRRKTSAGRAYLQIVESRRDGDQVRQQVIATLGRFEELQASGQLERLLRSGVRFAVKAMVLSAAADDAAIKIAMRRIGPALVRRSFDRKACSFELRPSVHDCLMILYPVHVMTRKSFGLMTRKLSVTKSQKSAQFRGTVSRRKPSVASANWAHVA